MLPGVCPGCGLTADLEVFALQAGIPQTIVAALNMPPALSGRVLPYLRLFAPPKKKLALSKLNRLMTELSEAVTKAEVKRNGITWTAPLALWEIGLDLVIHQPPERLPLDSHAYLFQVVANLAAKAAAKAEKAEEEQEKHERRFVATTGGFQSVGQVIGPVDKTRETGGETPPPPSPPPPPAPAPVRKGPPNGWLIETLQKIATGESNA